jgi:hypothetical protein
MAAALLLLGLVAAPLAHAALAGSANAHACCSGTGRCPDRSSSCDDLAALSCCTPGAPLSTTPEAQPISAPVAIEIRPAMREPVLRARIAAFVRPSDRAPIPPLLLKSVLLV